MKRVILSLNYDQEHLNVFTLRHEVNSESPWIVILPGLDDSILYYSNLFDRIKEELPNWNILAIDLKGQGETLKENGKVRELKVPIAKQASLVKQALDQENIQKCFVIGLSYAATVSLKTAIDCHDRVIGLGLIAPYVTNFKSYKKGLYGLYYHALSKHPAKKLIAMMGLPIYFSLAKFENRLNRNTLWDDVKLAALRKLTMGVLDFDTTKELKHIHQIEKGVHLLCGFDDSVIPITAHKNFYHEIPAGIEKTFSLEEGVGHRIFEEHPDVASHWIAKIVS